MGKQKSENVRFCLDASPHPRPDVDFTSTQAERENQNNEQEWVHFQNPDVGFYDTANSRTDTVGCSVAPFT
jgi:hypothetical protein